MKYLVLGMLGFFVTALSGHAIERRCIGFRESDPSSYVKGVSVIQGNFTAAEIDLVIAGPDPLVLTRFYNSEETSANFGEGWQIFPQTFLMFAQDSDGYQYSLVGASSGGIFTYSGDKGGPLKIDLVKDGAGLVNTHAENINGQTNHLNNRLHCKGDTCELVLGDGTRRLYRQTEEISYDFFGREISSVMRSKIRNPKYFQLISEQLPSGNVLLFSYENGCLSLVEIKNSSQTKLHASIRFSYEHKDDQSRIKATSSDERVLEYTFQHIKLQNHTVSLLKNVKGSHCIPISYDYEMHNGRYLLKRKNLPEGRFFNLEWDDLRVQCLKEPPTSSEESEIIWNFSYEEGFTDAYNAQGLKTKYRYDARQQLVAIEYYDKRRELYRIDRKYWGESDDAGVLKAMTVGDGAGHVHFLRMLQYDNQGNIEKEWLYGNLTGQKEVSLIVDEKGKLLNENQAESHLKRFKYSNNGLNLLTAIGDCKGNQVQLKYKKDTNRLLKKIIKSKTDEILKRTFYSYNQDGVCSQIIEDDGCEEDFEELQNVTAGHITVIHSKETAPGVGLPERVEENAYDLKTNKHILIRKFIHSYFPQGQLQCTDVYDAMNTYVYTTVKTYTALGQVATETDPEGRKILYDYDGVGNLILITIPHQKKTIEKKYDLRNQMFQSIEKADGLLAIEHYKYDNLGRKISSQDRFGQLTQFEYDEFNRQILVTYPAIRDEHKQPIQPVISYTHDVFGNVLSITDARGYITSKTYNIRGYPTQILYPDGTSELFKYDTEGTLHRFLTRENEVMVYEYDDLGRISHTETSKIVSEGEPIFLKGHSYEYNGLGVFEEKESEGVNAFELMTRFQRDPAGRMIAAIRYDGNLAENDPSSRKIEFIYDNLGREIKQKIWFGTGANDYSLECCEYDLLGQVREKRFENAEGRTLLQKYFDYDTAGGCIEEYTFHDGQRQTLTKTGYDPFGEPISYSDGPGNETVVIVDYSGNALRKTLIDPFGNQTEILFDALGHIASTIKRGPQGILLSSQNIFYDASDNKTLEMNESIWQGQSTGIQRTRWIYGPLERLEAQIEGEGTPEEKKTQFSYDRFGRLKTKTPPGASPLVYTYDKRGFMRQIEHKAKEKEQCISNRYSYDDSGNITSATSHNGITIERDYDAFGQIIQETINYLDTDTYSLNYFYDRRGRLTKIILPDQSKIAYSYTGLLGRSVKRLSSQGKLLYQHTYDAYDDQGRLSKETGITGSRIINHDQYGRKTGQQTDYFSEKVPEKGYDPLGSLLAVERQGVFRLQSGTYTYDALSQLVSEQTEHAKTYSNDSLGNCRFTNEEELEYNSLNQLTGNSKRECSYDPQGNLLRKILDKTEARFTSDIFSHLIAVEKDDGTALFCAYDPFGRRIAKDLFYIKGKKKISLSSSRVFYCGYHELGTLDADGRIHELRVPDLSSQGLSQTSIAIEIGQKIYAPLHDISGNVITLIDATTKTVAESYVYSAFAEERIYDATGNRIFRSAIGNPWRYKEKRVDEETGLIYFGFRYYDPDVRRWTSPDPLGFLDGPNLYAFLHNNPLTSFDQLGLATEKSSSDSLHQYFYGEVEKHCFCERHRDCKRGGDIRNVVGGASFGVSSFFMGIVNQFAEAGFLAAADDFGFDRALKTEMHDAMKYSLDQLHDMWKEGLVAAVDFDSQNKQSRFY
jgi:RHS repeat-associated protein